jgi:hypothetical protein
MRAIDEAERLALGLDDQSDIPRILGEMAAALPVVEDPKTNENRHSPDSRLIERDFPFLGGPRQRNSIAADPVDSRSGDTLCLAGP